MACIGFKLHIFSVLGLGLFVAAVDIAMEISPGDESCALQVRAAASVLARNDICPAYRPDYGAACSVSPDVTCEYDPITCPGDDGPINTTTASCSVSGEWSVRPIRIMCPQAANLSCPESRPAAGEQCTIDSEVRCNYNFVLCPGAIEETPTALARCTAGTWRIMMATPCPPSTTCPSEVPEPGSVCNQAVPGAATCEYGFETCSGDLAPTVIAYCINTVWEVNEQECAESTAQPTPAPTPATTLAAECVDIEKNHCAVYKEGGYCDTSPSVMRECAKTCGLCPGVCEDIELNHCEIYRRDGYCRTSPSVQRECKQTCGFCVSDCGGFEPTYCGFYEAEGLCDTDPGVERECKNACSFCA